MYSEEEDDTDDEAPAPKQVSEDKDEAPEVPEESDSEDELENIKV